MLIARGADISRADRFTFAQSFIYTSVKSKRLVYNIVVVIIMIAIMTVTDFSESKTCS